MKPQIQYATTEDDVSIAYWTMGEGGTPLVLASPIGHSHISLEFQVPELVEWYTRLSKDRMIVRFDQRGYGMSQRNIQEYSAAAWGRDLDAVVRALGSGPVHVYGLVNYCQTAVVFAAEHPERVDRLVLAYPQQGIDNLRNKETFDAFLSLARADWKTFTETMGHANLGWSRGSRGHDLAGFIRASVNQKDQIRLIEDTPNFDVTEYLPRVKAPTLVLEATKKRISIRGASLPFSSRIPGARLMTVEAEDVQQLTPQQNEVVAIAIEQFLDAEDEETPAVDQQAEPPAPAAAAGVVRRAGAGVTEPRVHYAKTEDGVGIAYWTLGEGEPIMWPPMAPVSSFDAALKSASARRWFDLLAKRGTLVAYDSRGGGLSGGNLSDVTLATNALDLEAVVAHLGIDKLTLWGGGFAGPAAITYAATHPDKVSHLALWCTFARASDAFSPAQIKPFMDLMESDWELFIDTWLRALSGWSPGEEQHDLVAKLTEDLTPESVRTLMDTLFETDVTALLANLESPTLVMHRRQIQMDVKVARSLASGIPNASLASWMEIRSLLRLATWTPSSPPSTNSWTMATAKEITRALRLRAKMRPRHGSVRRLRRKPSLQDVT